MNGKRKNDKLKYKKKKLRNAALQMIMLRKTKRQRSKRNYSQDIHRTKDMYPAHKKNSENRIVRKQNNST